MAPLPLPRPLAEIGLRTSAIIATGKAIGRGLPGEEEEGLRAY